MDDYFRVNDDCVQCCACIFACVFYGYDILYMTRYGPENECEVLPCSKCDVPCYSLCPNNAIEIGRD